MIKKITISRHKDCTHYSLFVFVGDHAAGASTEITVSASELIELRVLCKYAINNGYDPTGGKNKTFSESLTVE